MIQRTTTRVHQVALRDFARKIQDFEPGVIVAISRKAPRLIDLINRDPDLPDIAIERLVSEKSLPFMTEEMKDSRVLLVDDTLIYGSTFSDVERTIKHLGADVAGLVVAKSLDAHTATAQRVDAASTIPGHSIPEFIDREIRSFSELGVPYDVDHPILESEFADPMEFVKRIAANSNEVRETTPRWARSGSTRSFSVALTTSTSRGHSLAEYQFGPAKVRLFISDTFVRLVPIYCLALPDWQLENPSLFEKSHPILKETWTELIASVQRSTLPYALCAQSLAVAAHYLASTELALAFNRRLDYYTGTSWSASAKDARLLFGLEAGAKVAEAATSTLRDSTWESPPDKPVPAPVIDTFAEVAALEFARGGSDLVAELGRHLKFVPKGAWFDALSMVFEAQRTVYDTNTRGNTEQFESRLDVGVAFGAIPALLATWGRQISPYKFDVWCDRAIDNGSIVPKYAPARSDSSIWIRTVRFGENDFENWRHWSRFCLETASSAFHSWHDDDSNPEGLTWLLTEKIFAVLERTLSDRLKNDGHVELIRAYGQYGARPKLKAESGDEPFVTDHMVDHGVATKSNDKRKYKRRNGAGAQSKFVEVNVKSYDLLDPSRNPVDADLLTLSSQIIECFVAIEALHRGKESSDAVLALSTCCDEQSYLEALTTELRIWTDHEKFNSSRVVYALTDLSDALGAESASYAASVARRRLGDSSKILKETEHKARIFKQRLEIRDQVNELFEQDPSLRVLRSVWRTQLFRLIQPGPMSDTLSETRMLAAANLDVRAVSVARTVVDLVCGDVSASEPLLRRINAFNAVVQELAAVIPTEFLPDALDEQLADNLDGRVTCREAARRIEQCAKLTRYVLSRWRYPRPRNKYVEASQDWCVLFFDVVGSSTDPADDEYFGANGRMKRVVEYEVRSRNGRYDRGGTMDDGGVCVLPTVRAALEVAEALVREMSSSPRRLRFGVDTSTGGERLRMDIESRAIGGAAHQKAVRYMNAFRSSGVVNYQSTSPSSSNSASEPTDDYIVVSDHALRVLRHIDEASVPDSFIHLGDFLDFVPRVANGLPTNLRVYHWRSGDGS